MVVVSVYSALGSFLIKVPKLKSSICRSTTSAQRFHVLTSKKSTYLFLVCLHKLPPSLLSCLALHRALINYLADINLWEVFLEMLVDLLVKLGESQFRSLDLLKDVPVGLSMQDSLDSKLTLDLYRY